MVAKLPHRAPLPHKKGRMAEQQYFDRDSLDTPGVQDNMKPYKKKTVTMLMRVDGPFTVKTREGEVTSPDGWLAIDSKGWPYPVAADEFDSIYVPADEEVAPGEEESNNSTEDQTMDTQELNLRRKAASLELEGYEKLAEAQRIMDACNCGQAGACEAAMTTPPAIGMGAPQTVATEAVLPPQGLTVGAEPTTVTLVMAPQEKLASLQILNKVAQELFDHKDPEIRKLASEVDKIAEDLDKTAHVYESDTTDPELELHSAFKGGVDKHDKDETFMNEFKTDIHHEVAQAIKDKRVYQSVKD